MKTSAVVFGVIVLLGYAQALSLDILLQPATSFLEASFEAEAEDQTLAQTSLGNGSKSTFRLPRWVLKVEEELAIVGAAEEGAAAKVDEIPEAAKPQTETGDVVEAAAKSFLDIPASACGAALFGWEKHDDRLPEGKWMPYEAKDAAACVAACAGRPTQCVAAMWTDLDFPVPKAYANNSKCELVTALTQLARSVVPDGVDFYTPCNTGCDAEVQGYQRYVGTVPHGVWTPHAARSPADCAAACSARPDNCVAALWEDAMILPYGESSKCHLVGKLTGYTRDMPQGVDLYTKC